MRKKQPVYIDGKLFPSLKSASDFLRLPLTTLCDRLKGKKAIIYNDIYIEKKGEKKDWGRTGKHPKNPIPVMVDGVLYDSCNKASRACGLSDSSINYAVRNGLKKYKGHVIKKVKRENLVCPSFDELCPIQSLPTNKVEKKECPKFIKEAVANRIKELLKEKGIWEEIVEMLEYCNVDEFKIVK